MIKKCGLQERAHKKVGFFQQQEKNQFKQLPVEGADDPKHNKEDSSTFH